MLQIILLSFALFLTACGGGSSGSENSTPKVSALQKALSSGNASEVSQTQLLSSLRDELSFLLQGDPLLKKIYRDDSIVYDPSNRSQIIKIVGDKHKIFSILQGNAGNTLAAAGTKQKSRFAAFGAAPMEYFVAGDNLSYEAPFKRLLAWLITGESDDNLDKNRTIALSFSYADRKKIVTWLESNYPQWNIQQCQRDASDLQSCYSNADLVITGWQTAEMNRDKVEDALEELVKKGTPILYLHTWYEAYNSVAHTIARFLGFELPYGGNYWAKDKADWQSVELMQAGVVEQSGFKEITEVVEHFKDKDYVLDWSLCSKKDTERACVTKVGFDKKFRDAALKVKNLIASHEKGGRKLFDSDRYTLEKLLILLGDKYRQEVRYPMDRESTDANLFLKSLYADYSVYNLRQVNPAQHDMGNFSRSDFSHITPKSKSVTLQSKVNFRSSGVYALPGITMRVTRLDSSNVGTKIFINSLRSAATHEFQKNGYKRPKFLQTHHYKIQKGETLEITSPYGGVVFVGFDANDENVSFKFENIGEHAYWASSADDTSFTQKLATGDFDWAEVITSGFEVHSTLEKMRESVSDSRWGTAAVLAAATQRYMSNFPHVLAGFKGPGIDEVDEIVDFANTHGLTIKNLDKVKHMNADQATCGYGCSGNPYDAYWAYSPVGHGDVHELGHGLESSLIRFEGFETHSTTNPYSYYTKSKYNETLGYVGTECQKLPFEEVFKKLQLSVAETNTTAYLKENLWKNSNWSHQVMVMIQAMMHAQKEKKLKNGWHLLARLHILEREIKKAKDDWSNRKSSIGFSNYTLDEFNAIKNNDWMLVSFSFAVSLDFREYFEMMGIEFTSKAAEQVKSYSYTSVEKKFFLSTPNGYCKNDKFGDFLDKMSLDINGSAIWPN